MTIRVGGKPPFTRMPLDAAHAGRAVSPAGVTLARIATLAREGRITDIVDAGIPELRGIIGHDQRTRFHRHTTDVHTQLLLRHLLDDPAVRDKVTDDIILAALMHDIAKPTTGVDKGDGNFQYLTHAPEGAKMVAEILPRFGLDAASQRREGMVQLVESHMKPLPLMNEEGKGVLTDQALGRFVRNVLEPLSKVGIEADVLFAHTRADVLASAGPECCANLGIPEESNLVVLTSAVDRVISRLKDRVRRYAERSRQAAAVIPTTVDGRLLQSRGFLPGPGFRNLLARAAELEREGITGEDLVTRLITEFPQMMRT